MRIYKIIGNVTLSRCHPSYDAASLKIVQPEGLATLGAAAPEDPDLLVAWDERGAGEGCLVAVSDGAEAAQAFRPELKPVDAYCSAILDQVHVAAKTVNELNVE